MGLNDISYSQILQIKRGDKFEFTNLYIKFSSYLMNEKNINFKFFDDMLFKNIFKLEFKKFIEETNFKEIKDIYSYIRESLRSICFNGVKNFIKQDDYVGINEFLLKSKGNKINALENLFKVIEFDLSDEDVSNIIKNNNELVIELDTLLKENNPISDDRPITKLFVSIYSGDRKNITIVADSLEQKRKKEEIEAIRKVSQSDVIKKNKIQAEKLEKKTVDLFKYFDRKYTFKDLEAGIMLLENIDDRTLVYACCGFLLDGKSYKEKTKREFEDFKVRILPLLSEILEKNITIRANHADLLFILEHKYKLKDVISAIDSLPTKYRDNIYLVCGKKLNGISRDVLNQSDVKLFYDKSLVLLREYLTKYIEESLVVEKKEEVQVPKKEEKDGVRDCKKTSNLFEYYDNKYTKEQLMEAVLSFPPELSQLFLKKCGPQLDGIGSVALTPEENRALHNKCAWTTLNRRLEKISKSSQKLVVRRSPNDLVSYLEIYTYDEIKSVVDALDDDRKSIVYKKCGPMLNGEGSFQLTSEETKKFTSILARIKVRLNKKRNPVDGRSKRSSNLSSVNLIKKFENELTV